MVNDSQIDFDNLILELRQDISFTNRTNGSGLSYLVEVESDTRFYDLGEQEYRLVCYLDGTVTLREAFDLYQRSSRVAGTDRTDKTNNDYLSWEQAVQLFHFLHSQKLLSSINGKPVAIDATPQPDGRIQNVNPIGFRFRLFDAERVSTSLAKQLAWVFRPAAWIAWSLVVSWAILLVVSNPTDVLADTKLVMQPENWIWLALCWVFLKILHESAHAICCTAMGGKVGEAGINFILFLPMPFVDVSSSWKFESRWKRIYVALAGVYIELFVAALFVMVWAYNHNPILDSIAVQMILMASLTTVLFNINPLMKFDGYFVLSDLLRRPNLAINGAQYQQGWVSQMFFGIRSAENLSSFDVTTRIYGWLAAVWKVLIALGLIFAAAKLFHGAGIVLAVAAIFFWYVKPFFFFLVKLFSSATHQAPCRKRTLLSASGLAAMIWMSTVIPWPFAPSAVGVVDYSDQHIVRAPSDGFLTKILVRHGQPVSAGQRLAVIENQELNYQYRSMCVDRELAVFESRRLKKEGKLAEHQAEVQKIEKLEEQIQILQNQTGRLELVAPHAGTVVGSNLENFQGSFFEQGDEVMKVVKSDSLEIVSCVDEFAAPQFRNNQGKSVTVLTESGTKLQSQIDRVEPRAVKQVFHPALSAEYGGPLAVSASDSDDSKMELAQPVFKVTTVSLQQDVNPQADLRVGQRCRVHLASGSQSCFRTIHFHLSKWIHDNWSASSR